MTITKIRDRFSRSTSFSVTINRFDGAVTGSGYASLTAARAAGRQMLKEAAAAEQAALDEWARSAQREGGAGYGVDQ